MGVVGKASAFGLATMIALTGFATLAPRPASAETTPTTEEQGGADLLGGGDHRFIRFGTDAAFGVLWGNATNPNHIYLVAIKARYLGLADVRTAAGAVIDEDRPIKIHTVYALKLDSLIEFNDTNGDGIASYTRLVFGENYTGYVAAEPLLKRVSLNTSWTASPVTRTEDGDNRTWTFSLTALNQPYAIMDGSPTSETLDEVTFTFHLATTVVHVENRTVPHYSITVFRLGQLYVLTNVTRDGTTTWTGDRLAYTVKWDQHLVGWDFDLANTNPAIVLEFGAIVANRFPGDAPAWFDALIVARIQEGGTLRWRETSGETSASENTTYLQPRKLRDPWLRAGGDWSYIGRLTWVSNATVDGNPASVYAQVQGGILGVVRTGTATYVGFAILMGLSFPGGQDIRHDPAMDSDALVLTAEAPPAGGLGGAVVILAVVGLVAVIAIAVVASRRKRPKDPTALPVEGGNR